MFELTESSPEALSRTEMPAHYNAQQPTEPMAAPRLRSLFECLGELPKCRHARGKRYPLNTILALAVAARLAGYRVVNAFAQFAAPFSQEQLKAVGGFWSPSTQRYNAPATTPSTRSSPRSRPKHQTTPSPGGPVTTALRMDRSPYTERICAAPRSRPKAGAG